MALGSAMCPLVLVAQILTVTLSGSGLHAGWWFGLGSAVVEVFWVGLALVLLGLGVELLHGGSSGNPGQGWTPVQGPSPRSQGKGPSVEVGGPWPPPGATPFSSGEWSGSMA